MSMIDRRGRLFLVKLYGPSLPITDANTSYPDASHSHEDRSTDIHRAEGGVD